MSNAERINDEIIPSKPTYSQYLKIGELLQLQEPYSNKAGKPAHDEMLFIVIHQAYELWFKLIIHEIDSVAGLFSGNSVDETNICVAVSRLQRIVEIEKLLIEQINVLETMTPLDFLEFRGFIVGASGFQSAQFRIVENKLGLRPQQRLAYGSMPYHGEFNKAEKGTVLAAESDPSLYDLVERWLERTPFLNAGGFDFLTEYEKSFTRMFEEEKSAIRENRVLAPEDKELRLKMLIPTEKYFRAVFDEKEYQTLERSSPRFFSHKAFLAALFINLYRDRPILHMPFKFLEAILEVDEYLNLWRQRHAVMVLRMIGTKMGTGGSSGHEYLRATTEKHRIFHDLFALSTLLIPRSELPALGAELERELGFYFTTKG